MNRSPVVANRFYPGNLTELTETLDNIIPKNQEKQKALGAVCPHAGYIYSGKVAGETLSRIAIPETVVILGPNHSGRGKSVALSTNKWDMPMGDVPVNMALAGELLTNGSPVDEDEEAHNFEHSLEVQIPFLQSLQEKLSIVPICISHIPFSTCQTLADHIADAIRSYGKDVLIVASSDMSHYISRQEAKIQDHMALEKLLELNPADLYNTVIGNQISMCGIMPVTVMLLSCLQLGATQATLVRYTDSGAVSGDTDQVVGYAGAVVF